MFGHTGRRIGTRDRYQLQYLPLHPQALTPKQGYLPKRHPAINRGEFTVTTSMVMGKRE
jgi:hypothetical protein